VLEHPQDAVLAHHRTIIALDIEQSTRRTDPVKAELRDKVYELLEMALRSTGIYPRHRDRFVDRGDGVLVLIHPVKQAPKAILLNRAIPALGRLLADYNAGLPRTSVSYQLRVRIVLHAGEVRYDSHGCFGEALDVAFRLLDDARTKKALRVAAYPLALVVSGDIYSSVVRHEYNGIDQPPFQSLGYIQVAGNRHPGWIQVSEPTTGHRLIEMAEYRKRA
jgi:class 3 adenylate cyclase